MQYRRVTQADIPMIIRVCQRIHDESPVYGAFDRSLEELVTANLTAMKNAGVLHGIVAEDADANAYGLMLGVVSAPWYTDRVEACEQTLYVHPEHRGSSIAPRLIKEFEKLCKELGAWQIAAGATTGMTEDRTIQLYERLGYTVRSPTVSKRL